MDVLPEYYLQVGGGPKAHMIDKKTMETKINALVKSETAEGTVILAYNGDKVILKLTRKKGKWEKKVMPSGRAPSYGARLKPGGVHQLR
jgi:hypothetical protein